MAFFFQFYAIPQLQNTQREPAQSNGGRDARRRLREQFSDPARILSAALESLSMGRIGIMQESSNNLISAVTIAIRYAAVRKQFGLNGDQQQEELALIDYELHVSVFDKF